MNGPGFVGGCETRKGVLWPTQAIPASEGLVARREATFLQVADYYLVAQAHADAHVVVTHEVVTDTRKKIKIPNACIGLDIKCMTPFEMLRSEGARFVLGSTPSAEVA